MPYPYTVVELATAIKTLVEGTPDLRNVWLQGEVSNFVRATSGHCYYSLKDDRAVISCVMWRADAARLARLPQNGEQVLVRGYVSFYEAQGRVQFYTDLLEPAGRGRLYQEFEALRDRLAAEGLFDAANKRPLPAWPQRIGVVTSTRAAALRDILRTLAARDPLVEVLLAPAAVQGVEAPPQLVAALAWLNAWSATVEPLDVILLARGGGSMEELWAFNDEQVVRAIAHSAVPVVTGIGHETDFTLADFAADLRAPTPTGAASLATPHRQELQTQIAAQRDRLTLALTQRLTGERQRLAHSRSLLRRASPHTQITRRRQQTDDLALRLQRQMQHRLALRRAALEGLRARLTSLDPRAVLQRGFAIVSRADTGALVTSVQAAPPGAALRVTVSDGALDVTVSHSRKAENDG